jgi:hypothetical protein
MTDSTSTGKPARSTPVIRDISAVPTTIMIELRMRAGTKSRRGSSRYFPSLSSRSVRSALMRSDSRISALKAAVTVPK